MQSRISTRIHPIIKTSANSNLVKISDRVLCICKVLSIAVRRVCVDLVSVTCGTRDGTIVYWQLNLMRLNCAISSYPSAMLS